MQDLCRLSARGPGYAEIGRIKSRPRRRLPLRRWRAGRGQSKIMPWSPTSRPSAGAGLGRSRRRSAGRGCGPRCGRAHHGEVTIDQIRFSPHQRLNPASRCSSRQDHSPVDRQFAARRRRHFGAVPTAALFPIAGPQQAYSWRYQKSPRSRHHPGGSSAARVPPGRGAGSGQHRACKPDIARLDPFIRLTPVAYMALRPTVGRIARQRRAAGALPDRSQIRGVRPIGAGPSAICASRWRRCRPWYFRDPFWVQRAQGWARRCRKRVAMCLNLMGLIRA